MWLASAFLNSAHLSWSLATCTCTKMIRRPKATDTEEDLLSLQESFLSSGELPSASLHTQGGPLSTSGGRVQVGEKRREHADWSRQPIEHGRDVVQLLPQG